MSIPWPRFQRVSVTLAPGLLTSMTTTASPASSPVTATTIPSPAHDGGEKNLLSGTRRKPLFRSGRSSISVTSRGSVNVMIRN